MTDISEPDSELWTYVVNDGGHPKDHLWPPDSETEVAALSVSWAGASAAVDDAVKATGNVSKELLGAWPDPAGFSMHYSLDTTNNGSGGEGGIHDVAMAHAKIASFCGSYSQQLMSVKKAVCQVIHANEGKFELAGIMGGTSVTGWNAEGARVARRWFARRVANDIVAMMGEKQDRGFLDYVSAFGAGLFNAFAGNLEGVTALVGFDWENGWSWGTAVHAWKSLAELGLLFSSVGPEALLFNETVDLPFLHKGEIADTAIGAGKFLTAWDDWSKDPAYAAGEVTMNVGALLVARGASSGLRALATAAKASDVASVARFGTLLDRAMNLPKIRDVAIDGLKNLPKAVEPVRDLAGRDGPHLTEPPRADPPGPHEPGTGSPQPHSPEPPGPPHPPENVRPETPPRTDPPATGGSGHPDPTPRPESPAPVPERPSTPPEPGTSQAPRTPAGPAHESAAPRSSTVESGWAEPKAANPPWRDVTAHLDPETQAARLSGTVPPEQWRATTGVDRNAAWWAQKEWAEAAPVQPRTVPQKVLYAVVRGTGLVHTGIDMAEGHPLTPSSEPPKPHPTREPVPNDREKAPAEGRSTSDSLPPGDPGLPPRLGDGNHVVHVDPPEPPAPTPSGPPPPAPSPRPEGGAAPENRPPARSPQADIWDPAREPGPRRPGSKMQLDGFPLERPKRPEFPLRGGDHSGHPRVPAATGVGDVINPRPHAEPSGGVPHEHGHPGPSWEEVGKGHPLSPKKSMAFGQDKHGNPVQLEPNKIYGVTDQAGRARGNFITDQDGYVREVYTAAGRKGDWRPDARNPLPNADYHISGHDGTMYHYRTDGQGRTVVAEGDNLKHTGSDDARRQQTDQRAVNHEGRDEYRDYNRQVIADFQANHGRDPRPGEVKLYDDVSWNGGHLFGTEFGGPGERINMVPMLKTLNQSQRGQTFLTNFRALEEHLRGLLTSDPPHKIAVAIRLDYGNGVKAPPFIRVEHWVDGVRQDPLQYDNRPPLRRNHNP